MERVDNILLTGPAYLLREKVAVGIAFLLHLMSGNADGVAISAMHAMPQASRQGGSRGSADPPFRARSR